ncbi:MAG: ferritin-like domain-containing protein [Alphaproteobacteria bacterium]
MDLFEHAARSLALPDPIEKCEATRAWVAQWRALGEPVLAMDQRRDPGLTDRPGRLSKPELVSPNDVPKRKITGAPEGRRALLHAIAHIELNAVNLALDVAARYWDIPMPDAFHREWIGVADDEAKHFLLLNDRLGALDGRYGDLPAHNGLWESAIATKGDILARLAVVPMVLEARGLDVTPMMIEKFTQVGDLDTVEALKVIYEDEIGHVSIGRHWFEHVADERGLDREETWHTLVRTHFAGQVKRPFNKPARSEAGMRPEYYEPLADWYEGIDLSVA